MLLAADIGNAHTVVGLVADGSVDAEWRVATDDRRTADEWAVLRGAPEPRRTRRYAELSSSERIVPLVFALAHVVLVAGTLAG